MYCPNKFKKDSTQLIPQWFYQMTEIDWFNILAIFVIYFNRIELFL